MPFFRAQALQAQLHEYKSQKETLNAEMREAGVPENMVAMTALLKAVGATPGPGMAQEVARLFRRMARGPARCGGRLPGAGRRGGGGHCLHGARFSGPGR